MLAQKREAVRPPLLLCVLLFILLVCGGQFGGLGSPSVGCRLIPILHDVGHSLGHTGVAQVREVGLPLVAQQFRSSAKPSPYLT